MNNHKNSGGNQMSLTKSATRRLSLLAGSSLVAAGLTAIVTAGVAFMPSTALAQATCVSAPLPAGNGSNAVTYPAGTYNPGISCAYVGDNAVVSTAGPLTVSTTAGGNGINLTATGTSDISWDSTLATTANDAQVTGGNFTNGPVIDAASAAGNISIRTDNVSGSANTATFATNSTHAIRAISSGAGNVLIETASATGGGTSGATPPGVAGIEARSLGGGNVSVSATGTATGRLYGLLAQTTGAGTLTVQVGSPSGTGGSFSSGSDAASVGMHLTAGTGMVTVNSATQGLITSNTGTALYADYDGDAEFNLFNVVAPGLTTGATWNTDLVTAAGTTTTVNLAGVMGSSASGGNPDRRTLRFQGGGDLVFNVTGRVTGLVDLSGAAEVNMTLQGGQWWLGGASVFGAGDDTLTSDADGKMYVSTSLDFGAGQDRYASGGLLMLGTNSSSQANSGISTISGNFQLLNLEAFDNAGAIYMGGRSNFLELGSDGYPDDVLYLEGATFTGLDGSLILMDANLNGGQASCDNALRDATSDDMPGGDCLRIVGGATAGVTGLRVKESVSGDRGAFGSDIVLIDVAGGTSAAGHFILDEGSDRYNPTNGGVIDKGFFVYPLVYDAEAQQHKLVAVAGQNAQQFPLLAQAAHGLWRLSTGSWLDRQADMRGETGDGTGGGVWMRVATEFTDRDAIQVVDVLGTPFEFDNTHTQSSYTVTGGFDVITAATADASFVLGLTAGYAHSDLSFEESINELRIDGWTGGGYASFLSGGLFVDATVTGNRLELEGDIPALNLIPLGTMISTNMISVGGQVEAGWRFPFMGGAFVEPLAGVTYVRTKYDDLEIVADDPLRPPVTLEFDDPASLRASVGGRLGLDQDYGPVRAQYSLLGRVWNEFEDETRIVAHNLGEDATLLNEFTGSFTEVGLGASVYAMDGAVSGFVNVGGKFGDDYQAQTGSVGVRINW